MQVKDILDVKGVRLFTVAPDAWLSDAVVTMADQDIGSLVVMQNGKLAGMLTFREVIRVLAKRQRERRVGPTPPIAEIKVHEAMQSEPVITRLDADVNELRSLMLEHHARYVPIAQEDKIVGVISFHDVARAVLKETAFENQMLKSYIRDWPEDAATGGR